MGFLNIFYIIYINLNYNQINIFEVKYKIYNLLLHI